MAGGDTGNYEIKKRCLKISGWNGNNRHNECNGCHWTASNRFSTYSKDLPLKFERFTKDAITW